MARQVRGYEGTLLEAIEAGVVPRPERLRYREWLAWRAAEGQRPSRRRGDAAGTTTNGEEAELWRDVMRTLHGAEESEPEEISEASSDGEELLSAEDGTGGARAADGAGASGARPSGPALEDERPTPASSTVGNESVFKTPVTTEALEQAMARPYDVNRESAKKFARRLYRLADVLQEMGAEVNMPGVELKVARAIFTEKIKGQTPDDQLESLKEFFRELLLEDPPEEQEDEHEARLEVLLNMIQERGGKLSKTMGKVFSSNEGTPEKSGPSKMLERTPAGKGRGGASPAGVRRGDGFRSPDPNQSATEVADLKRRIEELEGDARSEASRGMDVSAFAEAIEKQTKIMAEALGKKQKRSTIQVSPKVQWPTLDDECSDYRSVQEFYDSFEATIGLANDGEGMTDMEKLTTLKACLKQHRLKTYELIYRRNLSAGTVKNDPGEVYRQIKSKHLMFSETAEEKELRVLEEGDALQKGKLSAFQWEVRWESHLADRDSVGLGLNAKEALIQYLRKIGPALSRDVRRDKRFRPDGSGRNVFRAVATWEEAHEVVKEIEETNAGQKALNNSTFAVKPGGHGKKEGDQIHAQGSESLAAKVCYEMRDKGSCSRGKDCKFSHDKSVVEEAKKKALKDKKQQGKPPGETVAKYEGGKKGGKGKGSGRKGADQGGSKGGQDDRKSKPCRFFNTAGGCSRGSKCPFSHAGQKQQTGTSAKSSSGPGLQLANLPDLPGVDGTGRGMDRSNPFGCFEPVVCRSQGQATETVLATDPRAKGKKGKSENKGKGNSNDLMSLDQLPKRWWTDAPNCKGGYQYQTEVKVLDRYVGCLLDGCAGCNSVTEEVVMGAIRTALQQGIGPDHEKFPVAQLERWPQEEVVMGLANDAPIKLKGAVVMRVQMPDVSGQKVEEILVRAKIIGKGLSTWHGLILGGRALDAVERGGLGFRPAASCHVFDALGVKLPRKEEMEPFPDRAYPFVSIPKSLFDQAWDLDKEMENEEVTVTGDLLVSAENLVLEPMSGDWIKVTSQEGLPSRQLCGRETVILPVKGAKVEVVPGMWDPDCVEGEVYVSVEDTEVVISKGEPLCVAVPAAIEQKVCPNCEVVEAAAWISGPECRVCKEVQLPANRGADVLCKRCGSRMVERARKGCARCRPSQLNGRPQVVLPLAGLMAFLTAGVAAKGAPDIIAKGAMSEVNSVPDSVFHIVETPGALDLMAEESPTDEYYQLLREDMQKRYPDASVHLLDHLEALEAFLDRSILAGMTFGIEKACVAVVEGELLGHVVGRSGARSNPERTKAVAGFPPLKEKLHIQQFLGCTNFLRNYLPPQYGYCAKVLGQYMKGTEKIPESGLGLGETQGDKAVKAIKLMAQRSIELAVLDEASAITQERPLEQIADSSGYAVGGSALQMRADLTGFNVLVTHSKGLTPAQQAWAPLSLEGYAQLEVRRAVKKILGPIKSICWTDHSNWTRQQTAENVEPKHLRWLSEILADGSELRSLSGRSARLGDGYSRNPPERDQLLEQRSKDLEGLIGQFRGFSLEGYLEEESNDILPWSVGEGVLPEAEGPHSKDAVSPVAAFVAQFGSDEERLRKNMSAAGVSPDLRVLYVPDYVSGSARLRQTQELSRRFRSTFPECDVKVSLSEGRFEDPEGHGCHFEKQGKQKLSGKKLANATRVDLLTSVATLLRNISHHNPHVIVAAGQGAIIGLAAASPVVVETVMLSRNIQQGEAHKLASAWAKVKIVAGVNPRISKANPGCQLLKEACPEMFKPHPLESIPRLGLLDGEIPKKEEIREFLGSAGIVLVESWESILWKGWLEKPSKEIWEHGGLCACGRRTRLFGQCMECIAQEHSEDKLARASKEEEECLEEDQEGDKERPLQSFSLKAEIERDEDTGMERLTKGAEDWLDQKYRERETLAEEARGATGSRLSIGQDLRNAWFKDQRSDPQLLPIIQSCCKKDQKEPRFRIADDGLLERLVHNADGQGSEKWVPVVPAGEAAHMMTWKEFCARQVHAGIMGAHRSGSKMLALLRRTCWWENMEADLEKFSDNCLTCIRGRKRPVKQQAVAVKPSWLECWEEVAVDFEGPMHPEDAAGNRFILSYMCCVSHSIMLEPCKSLTQMEVRKAFSKLMFRSRTVPKVLRSDRGQEFQSTLLKEYCAILGLRQKFSAPLRPCELGATERVHQETQKVLGLIVHDVCKAKPHEWGELLGVVEFVLDTTPGPTGIAPRDLERGWSLACPLERELLGQEVWEFEPVEEHTKKLFRSYREIRVKVLGWYAAASAKRADKANRFRKVKAVEIGDLVVYRDLRLRSGGRTPWRKQLSEPLRVVAQRGNRVDLESPDAGSAGGTSSRRFLRDVHIEDLLLVPPDALDVETKAACHFEEDDPHAPMAVRSPGMMLEERERATAAAEGVVPERTNKRTSQGKLASLRVGSMVAYAIDSIRANVPDNKHIKRCRVGQVKVIHPGTQQLQVQRYQPFADGRLRVLWKPLYLTADTKEETFEALGNEPLVEMVYLQRVITEVFLNSGVVNHASARRIDASGYRIDDRKSPSLVKEMEQIHSAAVQQAWVDAHSTLVAVAGSEGTPTKHEPGEEISSGLEGGPELDALLEQKHQESVGKWKDHALAKRWDEVKSDLSAYRFSGEIPTSDPRRTEEYRSAVVTGLGFSQDKRASKGWLNDQEFAACQEVLHRKAAAFWVPQTLRTTVRHVRHDTIPTGPPVKTPPHRLSPEAAEWIDKKIEEEVARGQLVRGNSPWGSPPFPTKEMPSHKRARKRRIVVDYRRVNARVLRNSYYSRKASEVILEAAGSAFLSMLDAVTGFNQVENTERAKRVLALVSRGGQFLPTCLTFGPQNGPEDFAHVVDRIYAPGKHRKMRLMKEWLPYVDDLTIRSGRVIDGVIYRDAEVTARVRDAVERSSVQEQQITEALEACGFRSRGLGVEQVRKNPEVPKRPEDTESKEKKENALVDRTTETEIALKPLGDLVGAGKSRVSSDLLGAELGGSLIETPNILVKKVLEVRWNVEGFEEHQRGPKSHSSCSTQVPCSRLKVQRAPSGAVESSLSEPTSGKAKVEEHRSSHLETCGPSWPRSEGLSVLVMGHGKGKGRGKKGLWNAKDCRWDVNEVSRRLTKVLRHGEGLSQQERLQQINSAGWAAASFLLRCLGIQPDDTTNDLLGRAVEVSGARLETSVTWQGLYVRARHSWSLPHVVDGLVLASIEQEPEVLFHGTTRQAWSGILRSGALMSEAALHGGRGRTDVHLVRRLEQIKKGSEVLLWVPTGLLARISHRAQYAPNRSGQEGSQTREHSPESYEDYTYETYDEEEEEEEEPNKADEGTEAGGRQAEVPGSQIETPKKETDVQESERERTKAPEQGVEVSEKKQEAEASNQDSKVHVQAEKQDALAVAKAQGSKVKEETIPWPTVPPPAPPKGAPRAAVKVQAHVVVAKHQGAQGVAEPKMKAAPKSLQEKAAKKEEATAKTEVAEPRSKAENWLEQESRGSGAAKGAQDVRRGVAEGQKPGAAGGAQGEQEKAVVKDSAKGKELGPSQEQVKKEEKGAEAPNKPEDESKRGSESDQQAAWPDWGNSSGSSEDSLRSRSDRRGPSQASPSGQDDAGGVRLTEGLGDRLRTEPSTTADRRSAVQAHISEHGSLPCPRCGADNARWRIKCYRCNLERKDVQGCLRSAIFPDW